MATPTYDLIYSKTLKSNASSFTINSISQDYRDLILVVRGAMTGGYAPRVTFNGDTGDNYSVVSMLGTGSSTSSLSDSIQDYLRLSYGISWGTDGQLSIMQIMDYTATDKHKTILERFNRTSEGTLALAGRWASTSALTSITLEASATFGQFASGMTFYLYGVAS